jgi:fatty acid desaturase
MKSLSVIQDPTYQPKSAYSALERFFLKGIRDERDLPFIHLMIKISLTLVPLGILLFLPLPGWAWWTAAFAYLFLNNITFKGPFGLMMHFTSHRKLFSQHWDLGNHYIPWILGPFFGQSPETYYAHHIGMHHVENNLEEDKSTTMYFQRDSFRSFMHYFLNFFFIGLTTLVEYLRGKNRNKLAGQAIRGEILFIVGCVLLSIVNFPATFVVFIFPFLFSRFIMMLGNFTQHAFIDVDEPDNIYKNSITCINTKYNKKCWNDGYHAAHHLRPSMHYSNYPIFFEENTEKYAANEAIVFDGMDYLKIFYYLMNKRYDVLAKHFVNLHGMCESEQDAINLMKSRTRRIPKAKFETEKRVKEAA